MGTSLRLDIIDLELLSFVSDGGQDCVFKAFQTFKIKLPDDYELVAVQRGIVQTKDDVHCILQTRC